MQTKAKIALLTTALLIQLPVLTIAKNENALAKSGREIVVAIIDTGVDTNHPLIKQNLWQGPHYLHSLGNGSATTLHGWNFVSNSSDISDQHGHGTHVAGIILQRAKDLNIKLMILKYYDPKQSAQDNLKNTVKAIRFAIDMKADIINYSGGGMQKNAIEEALVKEAEEKGILFVAAAGNEGRNTDQLGYYPAGYGFKNIISVAAMDSERQLLKTSNYGSHSVDIVAPGKNVFSALPNGKFGLMSGTSQATAWITGLAASVMARSIKPLKPFEVKSELVLNATKDDQLLNKIKSQARIAELQNTDI